MGYLADIDHLWGEDVEVSETGDIGTVTGAKRTVQRVIRRIITPSTDKTGSAYPWEPEYGAGLAKRVGDDVINSEIQGLVLGQLNREASVAPNPPPQVTVADIGAGTIAINGQFWDKSGVPQPFSFDLNQ